MKLARLFIMGIMAGSVLIGGCRADKKADQSAETAEIKEVDEAEAEKASESELESENVTASENETASETGMDSEEVDETESVKEHGKTEGIKKTYGEMNDDFYVAIVDIVATDSDDIMVDGVVHNSPLYVNTEVDVLCDGRRIEASIGGIETCYGKMLDSVNSVEPGGPFYDTVKIKLTGIDKKELHAGDIIVLRGAENPFEELFLFVEELTTADIPEEKAYIPAYAELIKQQEMYFGEICCELIYLNDDQIPELVVGPEDGFPCDYNLYSFGDGKLHTVEKGLGGGGAGGLGTYEYLPRRNVVRLCNAEYAGEKLYTYYARMNDSYELEDIYMICYEYIREDARDSSEEEYFYYYEGQKISYEEYMTYEIAEEFEYTVNIPGRRGGDNVKTAQEMLEELREMIDM